MFENRFTPGGHIVYGGVEVGLLQVVDEGSCIVVGKIELLPQFRVRESVRRS